jgi:stage II sporulation protein AA (anti-sigma F factor antagonist)
MDRPNPPPPLLNVDVLRKDDIAVAMCSGEVDMRNASQLEARLRQALDEGARDVVVNLRDVSFIDSAGLTALLRAAENARWRYGHLFLTRPTEQARRLIALTHTGAQLRVI